MPQSDDKIMQLLAKALPCPFCGEQPTTLREVDTSKWGAVECCCTGPEVRTGYEDVEHWAEAAVEEWNKRVSPQNDDRVERVARIIEAAFDDENMDHAAVRAMARQIVALLLPAQEQQVCCWCGRERAITSDGEWYPAGHGNFVPGGRQPLFPKEHTNG